MVLPHVTLKTLYPKSPYQQSRSVTKHWSESKVETQLQKCLSSSPYRLVTNIEGHDHIISNIPSRCGSAAGTISFNHLQPTRHDVACTNSQQPPTGFPDRRRVFKTRGSDCALLFFRAIWPNSFRSTRNLKAMRATLRSLQRCDHRTLHRPKVLVLLANLCQPTASMEPMVVA